MSPITRESSSIRSLSCSYVSKTSFNSRLSAFSLGESNTDSSTKKNTMPNKAEASKKRLVSRKRWRQVRSTLWYANVKGSYIYFVFRMAGGFPVILESLKSRQS